MINENIVKGKWNQIKGKIRESWAKLTDDELEETKGDFTKVAGLVQQRYGETQESVRERLNSYVASLGEDDKTADQDKRQTH